MANYNRVKGVGYGRWVGDETEPQVEQNGAELEELYFADGQLHLTLETEDGFLDIEIPVLARTDWDDFVESLPTWD